MILRESIKSKIGFRLPTMMALAAAVVWALSQSAFAQQGGVANYFYDSNGRLTAVLSPTGEAAIYNYDPAGNFTSITRRAANELSIIDFTPGSGSANIPVTIYGTGFSTTPSANTVRFNGVTTTVTSATMTQLVVTVPSGATTGPISVTNSNGTITSSRNFFISAGTVEFSRPILFGEALPFTFNRTVNRAPLVTVGMLTFDGVAGQRVSLFCDEIIPSGVRFVAGFSPYADVSIISPSGAIVTTFQIQDYTQYTDIFGYLDPIVLPATGSYTVLIDPRDALSTTLDQTGPYAFGATAHLYDVPPDITGAIAASGLPSPVSFNTPGQNAVLTFDGLNGQRICLQGSQDITTLIGTNVKVYSPGTYPGGTPLISQVLSSSFFVDTTTLAANGSYTILVDPQLNKTRAAVLTLYDVPPDVTGTLTIGAAAQTVNISSVGQAANLTFTVPVNQQVTIHIRNLLIGPLNAPSTLTLSTQGGTQIFTQTINANVDYDLPQTLSPGTYVIKIDPQQTYTGSLSIYLTTP